MFRLFKHAIYELKGSRPLKPSELSYIQRRYFSRPRNPPNPSKDPKEKLGEQLRHTKESLEDMEKSMMRMLSMHNKRKFRFILGGLTFTGVGCFTFSDRISTFLANRVSTVTQKTLDHEDVRNNLEKQADYLIEYLYNNPQTYDVLAGVVAKLCEREDVQQSVSSLLGDASIDALNDEENQEHLAKSLRAIVVKSITPGFFKRKKPVEEIKEDNVSL